MLAEARRSDADRQAECRPPAHEVVEWHLTYIAEAFLPSHAGLLAERLRTVGWAEQAMAPRGELVPWLRGRSIGGGWANLADLLPLKGQPGPFVKRASLPDGVLRVGIRLMSITSSLTLMVASFEWDNWWREELDRIAKTDYETQFVPASGGGFVQYDPFSYKQLQARYERRRMHKHVASWLTDRFPGAFRELNANLPTLDVITSARARPFQEEPPLTTFDYREALSLERLFPIAESNTLPGWRVALSNPEDPTVLTLGGRTADVFSRPALGQFYEQSATGLDAMLSFRIQELMSSWATVNLMGSLHRYLASTRDRVPTRDESTGRFARRLSRDVDQVLRRGTDAGAVCADLLAAPSRDPLGFVRSLAFTVDLGGTTTKLSDTWSQWIADQAEGVRRLEQDQREWLAASTGVSGLAVNIRLQRWIGLFAVLALLLTSAGVWIAILELQATRATNHQAPTRASRTSR